MLLRTGARIRNSAPNASNTWIPSMIYGAFQLDFKDLSANVVDVRADNETFLPSG